MPHREPDPRPNPEVGPKAGRPDLPQISDAEWTVMRVLWDRSPRTAAEVTEEVAPTTGWKPGTVKTLLGRLVSKGAVGFDQQGKSYLYRPLVAEAECVRAESRSFLSRVFGGTLAPMLAHFVENEKLSPEQIAELKKILDRAQKGDRPGNGE